MRYSCRHRVLDFITREAKFISYGVFARNLMINNNVYKMTFGRLYIDNWYNEHSRPVHFIHS